MKKNWIVITMFFLLSIIVMANKDNMILVEGGKTGSFYISKYEVTQEEYKLIMGYNPSHFKGDNLPVEQVTWYDAVMYCNMLSKKEGLAEYYSIKDIKKDGDNITEANVDIVGGKGYRLPTEAEWGYAARGGNKSKGYEYSGSDDIEEVAWYRSNSGDKTHAVGTKKANELGIYDMTGNVWEWCWGIFFGLGRVFRGGCWYNDNNCTVSSRIGYGPYNRFHFGGFRPVRTY